MRRCEFAIFVKFFLLKMLFHYEYKFRNETILSVHATKEMQLIFERRRFDIVLKAKIHLKPFARRKEITIKQTGVFFRRNQRKINCLSVGRLTADFYY